jgi:nucleoside-diphosphate-sugar epimerase
MAFVGGTRFIGHAAAALAVARGHEVAVLHRGRHPCELAGARPILVDRTDPSALCESIVRLAPEVIGDTRAMTRPDAESSALALKIVRVPAVVLSSQDVYAQFGRLNGLAAPPPEPVVTESSPLTIPFPFRDLAGHEAGPDYDKKDVEAVFAAATAEGVPCATILRLPAVYGPRDPKRRFGALVDALDRGERRVPCQGGALWRWTHADVRDVALAIVLAAEKPGTGTRIFNVGERETPTMRARAEGIAASMGLSVEWEETTAPPECFEWLGVQPNDLVVSSARIREELGFAECTTEAARFSALVASLRESRAAG